jgi:hypothetical protein
MRAFLPIFTVFAASFLFTEAAWGQEPNSYTKVANQLVELINTGDYAGIQTKFNKEMEAALPLDKSSAFFNRLTQQVGKIQKLGEPQPVREAMVFPTKFEKGTLDMQITLDGSGLISGLNFKPHVAAKSEPEKHQAQFSQTDRYTKVANQLAELINVGDYTGIQTKFTKELGAALPLDKSSEFFKGLTQQVGKIQKLGKPQPVGEGMVFPAEFEKGTLDMQITLDGRSLVAELNFTPHVVR